MITGTNTQNRNVRFEVGELQIGETVVTPDMLGITAKADAPDVADVSLSGTYRADKDEIEGALNMILSALREQGIVK